MLALYDRLVVDLGTHVGPWGGISAAPNGPYNWRSHYTLDLVSTWPSSGPLQDPSEVLGGWSGAQHLPYRTSGSDMLKRKRFSKRSGRRP